MDGSINFSGTLAGSIADSGGGGSTVTIEPTLESGTKIANYSINGVNGVLYAPTPTSLSANLPLSISNNVLSIDLSDYMTESEIYTFFPTTSYVNNMFQSMSRDLQENYQKKLVAGTNITIDPLTNTISASGGSSWNYSTSEVNTGQKWIDGKDIYCKVINNISLVGTSTTVSIPNVDKLIKFDGYLLSSDSNYSVPIASYWETTNYHNSTFFDYVNSNAVIVHTIQTSTTYPNGVLIAYYTKSTT